MSTRTKLRFVARVLLVVMLVLGIAVSAGVVWVVRSTPYVRDSILAALNGQFDAHVDAETMRVAAYPRPLVAGTQLVITRNDDRDLPPLLVIRSFEASAGLSGLLGRPTHLRNVRLEGLNIHVPPGAAKPNAPVPSRGNLAPAPRAVATTGPRPAASLIVDEIVTRDARLEIASRKPGRLPRVFDIQTLVMSGYGRPEPARFHATLVNPVPKGRIDTDGTFGPWNAESPGQTTVTGNYTFTDANLDVIKGIGGILSSTGNYRGELERIEVEGRTDTPDFSIDLAGQAVPLSTTFKAVVDGTSGDTWLERVDATLGQSTIVATGAVIRTQDVKGRRVALDIQIARARLEDLLRLAVKGRAPIAGRAEITTKFLLPAGTGSVVDRLQLDGRFDIAQARFANVDVQKKITMLSQRGRGNEQGDGTGESIVSNLRGQFVLRNGQISFSTLSFAVPGAQVHLTGWYSLRGELMDFSGELLTDASLADMTHGFKALVARVAQPFFRRQGGGSKFPIRISGPRTEPSFRVDVKRAFLKR